jgi:hypothetical protein
MKKIIILAILLALSWKAYSRYSHHVSQIETVPKPAFDSGSDADKVPDIELQSSGQSSFACDGRMHCSQMKSCEEAKYFLQHCPNVKMDGDNDGIPCEQQWCT